ncbi:ABC transporter family protein [Tritrichomonas foetus]|uniref:ABC transporter family protein n=1 Tax=Tritrichomonas foetus TaxID=1144522 RepID=A0A1J4KAK2_9EUKA|nr:ABC transporter family protein [Tritrichomonas foetus]|eukprot:OHT06724.1 ABC transporter family protein [Tritrichomonas foetus]
MSGMNKDRIGEILLDDVGAQRDETYQTKKSKRKYLPFVPKMYWFFYRKPIHFLMFIPSFLSGWIMVISNLTMAKIIDSINDPNALSIIKKYAFINFLAAIFSAICTFADNYFWILVGSKIGIKIKRVLFKALMCKDIEFFDNHPFGDILTILSEDTRVVESAFSSTKAMQVRIIGQLISSIAVSFGIDWRLSMFALTSTLVISFIVKLFREAARIQLRLARKFDGRSLTIADEDLSNARTLFAFNRQKLEIERYSDEVHLQCNLSAKAKILFNISFGLGHLLDNGTVCVCLNVGAFLIMKGQLTPGTLFALSRSAFMIGSQLSSLLSTLGMDHKAYESADKIFEIVDETTSVPFDEGRTIPDFKGTIELQNVWFKYPTRNAWILKGVSLKIEAGQIAAIVGHSGSGKSTIVQILSCYYDVNSGKVLLDGVDITELNPRWLHSVISVVQQEPVLFAMTIRENVIYGLDHEPSDTELDRVLELSQSAKFVSKLPFKVDTMVGEKGSTLSGGQKQRIAIARSIIRDPTILLTDEATSALDSQSERKVQVALDEIMRGRTSVIIAHRLGTIRAAQIIYVLESGELVETGTHDELISLHGRYYTLVERQLSKQHEKDLFVKTE